MTSKAVNTGLTSTHCTLPTRSGVWADGSIHTVVQGGVKDGQEIWFDATISDSSRTRVSFRLGQADAANLAAALQRELGWYAIHRRWDSEEVSQA
jgi:hypothetical protein